MRNKPSLLMNSLFSMTRKRQLTILRQLECYGHLSGQQLAQACGASRRTIISDIEELRQQFGASTILASASNGYELVIQELAEYQEKSEHCWRMTQICCFCISCVSKKRRYLKNWLPSPG